MAGKGIRPGRGGGMSLRLLRRPSGADALGGRFRWLTPPANFHRPFGTADLSAPRLFPPRRLSPTHAEADGTRCAPASRQVAGALQAGFAAGEEGDEVVGGRGGAEFALRGGVFEDAGEEADDAEVIGGEGARDGDAKDVAHGEGHAGK